MTKKIESEVAEMPTFTKDQIIKSQKYKDRDIVTVVLKEDESYTLDQVEDLIQKFMKVEVK